MIEKIIAAKILSLYHRQLFQKAGKAYAFGDQRPTFSSDWAEEALSRTRKGQGIKRVTDMGNAMEAAAFFKLCEFSSYTDIDYNGKAQLLTDLGRPLPAQLYGAADFLYDGGTAEHIPNIYQALCNAVLLLNTGGILIEALPVNAFGLTYYNIDPMLLKDFFTTNGFEMIECFMYAYDDWRIRLKALVRGLMPSASLSNCYKTIHDNTSKYRQSPLTNFFLSTDHLTSVRLFDPFARAIPKIPLGGFPANMHTCFIGKKIRQIKPEQIIAPCQGQYPSAMQQTARSA